MADARKKPCCICRCWFRPDPRVGLRQRACRKPDCQVARRKKKQKEWRKGHLDYFVARRIQGRNQEERPPEPLELPPPLNQLPWDIAQDEFGAMGADFIGVLGAVLLRTAQSQFKAYVAEVLRLTDTLRPESAQSQFKAYRTEARGVTDTLPSESAQSQIRPVRESVRVEKNRNEAGISPTRPPT